MKRMAALSAAVSVLMFSLSTGYRALSVEMEEGSGASEKGLDIIMHGLLINARFTF
jgi:hypothetical protein